MPCCTIDIKQLHIATLLFVSYHCHCYLTFNIFCTVPQNSSGWHPSSFWGRLSSSLTFSLPINDVKSNTDVLLGHISKVTPQLLMAVRRFIIIWPDLMSKLAHWRLVAAQSNAIAAVIKFRVNASVTRNMRCSSSGTTWLSFMWISGSHTFPCCCYII